MVQVSDQTEIAWDAIADVVVVGSGAAGMSAALTAAEAGASVTLLERGDQLGGTTAKSGGSLWIPNNPLQRARGHVDNHDDAVAYIARLADPQRYDPELPCLGLEANHYELIDTFCRRASEALDALTSIGGIHLVTQTATGEPVSSLPDYQSDLPENKSIMGRTVRPGWPGEELPEEFRGGNPALIGGMLMIETMRRAAVARGSKILTNYRVTDTVVDDDDRVIGVVAHVGRRTELIGARKGVIFGSGGFLMNVERSHEFLRGPVFGGCAAHTNEGDLIDIASRLGAELGNMTHAWWDQVVLEVALANRSTAEDIWVAYGDSMIQVSKYGVRVVNEKQMYNERGQVHFVWNPSKREYSNMLLFQIWDESVASDPRESPFRGFVPYPGENVDYVLSAPTLDELADKIDARLAELGSKTGQFRLDETFKENLPATIGRFNEFARTGVDADFQRGGAPLQLLWQAPALSDVPNPCMAPIADTGPYYTMILAAGALDTKGGPKTNTNAQMLRTDGEPIPGLYGAGNCVASPMGQAYPGGGGTLGPAVTFGYIAGLHAAADEGVELQCP